MVPGGPQEGTAMQSAPETIESLVPPQSLIIEGANRLVPGWYRVGTGLVPGWYRTRLSSMFPARLSPMPHHPLSSHRRHPRLLPRRSLHQQPGHQPPQHDLHEHSNRSTGASNLAEPTDQLSSALQSPARQALQPAQSPYSTGRPTDQQGLATLLNPRIN